MGRLPSVAAALLGIIVLVMSLTHTGWDMLYNMIPAFLIFAAAYLGWKDNGWGAGGMVAVGVVCLIFFRIRIVPLVILPLLVFAVAAYYLYEHFR